MAAELAANSPYRTDITVGLLVSVGIHVILFYLLFVARAPALTVPSTIDVTFEIEPQKKEQAKSQIVTPPDQALEEKPLDTSPLVSDRDFKVERESIKRGDAPNAGPDTRPHSKPQRESPPKSVGKTQEQTPPPVLKQLTLDEDTLREKFAEKPQPTDKAPNSKTTDIASYQAFSRPSGSGASVFGTDGSSDYLPYLPDGDLTLLNAKAEKFAVFVRRVALQVFSNLRQSGWDQLTASNIRSIVNYATITAVLSPQGKLLKVTIEDGSGSPLFDSVVEQSVRKGAVDPNPPAPAVAPDGNIHFIFKSRSWSDVGLDRRSGNPFERRWLMLSTGLE